MILKVSIVSSIIILCVLLIGFFFYPANEFKELTAVSKSDQLSSRIVGEEFDRLLLLVDIPEERIDFRYLSTFTVGLIESYGKKTSIYAISDENSKEQTICQNLPYNEAIQKFESFNLQDATLNENVFDKGMSLLLNDLVVNDNSRDLVSVVVIARGFNRGQQSLDIAENIKKYATLSFVSPVRVPYGEEVYGYLQKFVSSPKSTDKKISRNNLFVEDSYFLLSKKMNTVSIFAKNKEKTLMTSSMSCMQVDYQKIDKNTKFHCNVEFTHLKGPDFNGEFEVKFVEAGNLETHYFQKPGVCKIKGKIKDGKSQKCKFQLKKFSKTQKDMQNLPEQLYMEFVGNPQIRLTETGHSIPINIFKNKFQHPKKTVHAVVSMQGAGATVFQATFISACSTKVEDGLLHHGHRKYMLDENGEELPVTVKIEKYVISEMIEDSECSQTFLDLFGFKGVDDFTIGTEYFKEFWHALMNGTLPEPQSKCVGCKYKEGFTQEMYRRGNISELKETINDQTTPKLPSPNAFTFVLKIEGADKDALLQKITNLIRMTSHKDPRIPFFALVVCQELGTCEKDPITFKNAIKNLQMANARKVFDSKIYDFQKGDSIDAPKVNSIDINVCKIGMEADKYLGKFCTGCKVENGECKYGKCICKPHRSGIKCEKNICSKICKFGQCDYDGKCICDNDLYTGEKCDELINGEQNFSFLIVGVIVCCVLLVVVVLWILRIKNKENGDDTNKKDDGDNNKKDDDDTKKKDDTKTVKNGERTDNTNRRILEKTRHKE